jgi:DNA-binding NtrC family response regulator
MHFSMKPALLIVEDERELREFLMTLLWEAGDPVGARNGEEALELARKRSFDVVLCDFVLPGLKGFDLVQAFQDLSDPPKVILVTGYADRELVERAAARGVFAVFGKPFGIDALLGKVTEAIAARRTRPNPSNAGVP